MATTPTTRAPTVLAAVLCLIGCGPRATTAGGAGAAGPAADRVAPRVSVRADVLPIPETRGVLALDLGQVLASPALRQHLKPWLAQLTARATSGAAATPRLARCGVRLDRDVETFVTDLPSGPDTRSPGIYLLTGRFHAKRVLGCLERAGRAAGKPVERFSLGPVTGLRDFGGQGPWLLALGRKRLLYASARSVASVRSVLTGAAPSISRSALYRATRGTASKAPPLLWVIPSVRESLRASRVPVVDKILAVGARVTLPEGGLDLLGLLPFDDPQAARRFVQDLPTLLMLARAKLPVLDRVTKRLRLSQRSADPTVVEVRLRLPKPDLQAVLALLTKTLKRSGQTGSPARPGP